MVKIIYWFACIFVNLFNSHVKKFSIESDFHTERCLKVFYDLKLRANGRALFHCLPKEKNFIIWYQE